MAIVYINTGKLDLTLSIGSLDIFIKMIFYFIHERIWDKISFGRKIQEPPVDHGTNKLKNLENSYLPYIQKFVTILLF
jgi:uncharacterized membrane protein